CDGPCALPPDGRGAARLRRRAALRNQAARPALSVPRLRKNFSRRSTSLMDRMKLVTPYSLPLWIKGLRASTQVRAFVYRPEASVTTCASAVIWSERAAVKDA